MGASAAVASIITFFIMNFPHEKIILYIFPVPAWVVGILMFVQSIALYDSNSGVSHSGHLGGIVAGVGMHYWIRRKRF